MEKNKNSDQKDLSQPRDAFESWAIQQREEKTDYQVFKAGWEASLGSIKDKIGSPVESREMSEEDKKRLFKALSDVFGWDENPDSGGERLKDEDKKGNLGQN